MNTTLSRRIMNVIRDRRSGQTLVEALVALTVLTAGFLGIVTLLTKSFQLNRITANDTQATYLAAEGIEITKNIIDHDLYAGLAGNVNFGWGSSFPLSGYYYNIDYTTTDIPSPPADYSPNQPQSTPLDFDPNTDMYSYTSGATSDFIRNIKVINNGPIIDVQSTVSWGSGALSDSVTLEDQFYDWHP